MDAFASIDLECGKISDSQEELLRDAPFIFDSQPPSPSPSNGNIFTTPPSPSDPPRYADAPILICSLPDSQNSDPPSPKPHAKPPPEVTSPLPKSSQIPPSSSIPNPQDKSPAGQADQGDSRRDDSVSAKQVRYSPRVWIKSGRGAKIRTPSDDDDGDGGATTKTVDDVDKYRFQWRQPLKDDALVLRKLPPTLQNQQEGSIAPEPGLLPAAEDLVETVHNAEERDGGVGKLKDPLGKYRYNYTYKSLKDAIFGQNDAPVAQKLSPGNRNQREGVIVSDSASMALDGASAQPVPVVGEGDGGVTRSKDDLDKYRYKSLQSLKDAVSRQDTACRDATMPHKLPSKFQNQQESSIVTESRQYTACRDATMPQKLPSQFQNQQEPSIVTASSSPAGALVQPVPTAEIVADYARAPAVPAGLADLISPLSKENEPIFADTDILDFSASEGIHFPPPRWWRPGGYDAKVSKEAN